jgi:hypothetical protein
LFKPIVLIVSALILVFGYWFYSNLVTPDENSRVRVSNLPWQITVVDPQTLHVLDLDLGKATLGEAINVFNSEYKLAWFEKPDSSVSLEAYFLRVSMSGLRAKIVLELDTETLDLDFLKRHSGQPEILASHSIKYPLDDLGEALSNRLIRSMTYIPQSSVDPDILKRKFGQPQEQLKLNEESEFWLYPEKGLVINVDLNGKEAFQYVPVADFERLRKTVQATLAKPN